MFVIRDSSSTFQFVTKIHSKLSKKLTKCTRFACFFSSFPYTECDNNQKDVFTLFLVLLITVTTRQFLHIFFQIIFPTGTSVKVSIYNYESSSWYINLEVYPTVADVNRTSGLCGVLDDDDTNDLRRRDGTQDNIKSYSNYNPPDVFSLSWQ